MNRSSATLLGLLILCAGCRSVRFGERGGKSDFEKKVTCSRAAEGILKVRGSWYTGDDTYIDESFYSPKRDSCIAVLVLTTGGPKMDSLSDTYDIVDTLTYQLIRHASSSTGPDRTKTSEEIEKEISELKR
ncbi:MAG TPA: hypothetical protein VG225_12095 [Terracidiphilus sp.]|jgi:hypothetical protein|nr:hypothetical protein [Terracidiphilus sp.]